MPHFILTKLLKSGWATLEKISIWLAWHVVVEMKRNSPWTSIGPKTSLTSLDSPGDIAIYSDMTSVYRFACSGESGTSRPTPISHFKQLKRDVMVRSRLGWCFRTLQPLRQHRKQHMLMIAKNGSFLFRSCRPPLNSSHIHSQ